MYGVDSSKYFKFINYQKLEDEVRSRYKSNAEFCRGIGKSSHCMADIKRQKGKVAIATMNLICYALGKELDFFDKIEEPEPIENPKEEPEECLINLADIQLSLNKIEALLLEQNRILRGKLVKGESNEIKGNTNHGCGHGYTIVPTNL